MFGPHHSPRHPFALLLVIAASTLALTAARRHARATPTSRPPASCATPEFRQFDFFAGDWDTYDVTNPSKIVARNRVTVVLDGCAVREVYEQDDGLVGESLSLYDGSRRRWRTCAKGRCVRRTGEGRTPVFDIVFRPHRPQRESP